MTTATIPGIHHITAIAGDPQRNLDFYTSILGLPPVKFTVNFDDPGTTSPGARRTMHSNCNGATTSRGVATT
jgi:catechol 2,3-dioxygenase-like lactoylglutathione lyase family enzyme